VLYKPYIRGESKGKKEKFTNKECSPFSVPPTPPPISSDMLITIILSVLGAIAGFIGVYFAVKFAAGPTGEIMQKIGQSLGRGLVAIKKSIPSTPESRLAAPTTQENPMLTKTQEKVAEKAEPSIDEGLKTQEKVAEKAEPSIDEGLKALETKESEKAEKRLSTSLTKENPFFRGKTQRQFKEGKTQKDAAGTGLLSAETMRARDEANRTRRVPPGYRVKRDSKGNVKYINKIEGSSRTRVAD
jgi:hypothetical protein